MTDKPQQPPPKYDFGPTDEADLLTPSGTLSHGGREYRRRLVGQVLQGWLSGGRGALTSADIETAIGYANHVIISLAARPAGGSFSADPPQVAETPPTR